MRGRKAGSFSRRGAQNSGSCVLLFSCFYFSGLFYNISMAQLFHRALPLTSSEGNTIVKESFSHVTVRGVHLQLIMSATARWPLLVTHISRVPWEGLLSTDLDGGLCHCSTLEPWHFMPPSQARPCFLFRTQCWTFL